MATSTISNTILDPLGVAVPSVRVVAKLMPTAGFREDTLTEVARICETTSDSNGAWSLALERNSNISPEDTYYEITEFIPVADGGTRKWFIQVGASDQTVYAALISPLPDVASANYITQDSGDARYQALGSYGGAPNTIEPDDAASAGVASSASRSDHEHGIVTAAPSDIGLTGTNSEGAATSFARSNHVHAYNPPSCRVHHNTTQSVNNNVNTVVAFNSERWDTSLMHDTAVNNTRITIPTGAGGLYLITAGISYPSGTDYIYAYVALRINGATFIADQFNYPEAGGNALDVRVALSTVYKLTAGDYIEVITAQRNVAATARNVQSTGNISPEFSATWIGVG